MTALDPTPRWRRLPEERPQQILEAALAEFGERGLAAARLEDVAKRAGVSKGTIYLYFANKEDLFRGVIRGTVVPQIERGEQMMASAGSATEALREHMRRHWTFIRSPQFAPIFRLVLAELQNHPDLARFYAEEVVSRGHRLVSAMIKRGVESGEFRDVDPDVAARMMMAPLVMHGLWCRHRDLFPWMANKTDDQTLSELTDFFLGSLSNERSPERT